VIGEVKLWVEYSLGGLNTPRIWIPEVEAISVWCPREKKSVPHWKCLGSFVQGVSMCPDLISATICFHRGKADIDCYPKRGKVRNKIDFIKRARREDWREVGAG